MYLPLILLKGIVELLLAILIFACVDLLKPYSLARSSGDNHLLPTFAYTSAKPLVSKFTDITCPYVDAEIDFSLTQTLDVALNLPVADLYPGFREFLHEIRDDFGHQADRDGRRHADGNAAARVIKKLADRKSVV